MMESAEPAQTEPSLFSCKGKLGGTRVVVKATRHRCDLAEPSHHVIESITHRNIDRAVN